MSDTEANTMENVPENEEMTKEQRLEAARKKFEEMKKKKKKDKKKKSKNTDTETGGGGGGEEEEGEKETVKEKSEREDTSSNKGEDISKKQTEANMETKPGTRDEPIPKETTSDDDNDGHDVVVGDIQSDPIEQSKDLLHSTGQDLSKSESVSVEDLKKIIEDQEKTIQALKDEIKNIKLSKMELDDQISDLKLENEQLKKIESKATVAVSSGEARPAAPVYSHPITVAMQAITTNEYATISQQNLNKSSSTEDFREKLMVWKGWQVDMREWSNPVTQIVL
ncbi:hypothetical protein KGF56_000367 [Candida oxycetoniae]|uniref:Uncharacterized protein n=1 Tax=Candida oxycetoniae TaxID=497107 RepID=A0AAI9T191_9ASCO|nr:uncharacterized protein KGF56_000367 [Candida oxycetoniae]KAI3406762.2 hypothetical protein KGF56_000367 [Candida oxycetoniae]